VNSIRNLQSEIRYHHSNLRSRCAPSSRSVSVVSLHRWWAGIKICGRPRRHPTADSQDRHRSAHFVRNRQWIGAARRFDPLLFILGHRDRQRVVGIFEINHPRDEHPTGRHIELVGRQLDWERIPQGEPGGRGPIAFDVDYPSAGAYRMYLQFRHRGVIHTAAFTEIVGGASPLAREVHNGNGADHAH